MSEVKTEVRGQKSEVDSGTSQIDKTVKEVAVADAVEVSVEVRNIIEALIFASDEPMSVRFIRSLVDEANKDLQPHEQIAINAEIIRKVVSDLNKGYAKVGSSFRILEIAGGFVHATQEQFAAWVGKLAKEKARRRLSPTAIETLAIIAYKQPITKAEVEFIRGVNADYIINALLEKDLITITGRQNSPGRPLLYGTTQKFLEHFGLNELTDLPKPREIAELINETEAEVDRRLLAEQQELEFKEGLEEKLEGHEGVGKTKGTGEGAKKRKGDKAAEAVAESSKEEGVGSGGESSQQSVVSGQMLERSMEKAVESKESVSSQRSDVGVRDVDKTVKERMVDDSTRRGEVEEKSEIEVPKSDVEEKVKTKSSGVSEVSEIDEQKVEEQIESPIEAEERVEDSIEANAETAVPFYQEKNINENLRPRRGDELSAQHGNIEEQIHLETGSSDTSTEQSSGWSKWKTKVKTFFKKLFG